MKKNLFAILSFFLITACMSPTLRLPSTSHLDMDKTRREMLKAKLDKQSQTAQKINTLYYNIKKSTGQELCDIELIPDLGLGFRHFYTWGFKVFIPKESLIEIDDMQKIYRQKSGSIFVDYVIKDSAADKAGIKKGDVITSYFGIAIPTGKNAFKKMYELIEDNYTKGLSIPIGVSRKKTELVIDVMPDMVCGYPLFIDENAPEANAYADGNSITVNQALIDKSTDDVLLATIIAHELAHNTMGHVTSGKINALGAYALGTVSDMFLGTNLAEHAAYYGHMAFSKEFEHEADVMAVYYMARAGYDYKKTKNLGKFLTILNYRSLYQDGDTHPPAHYRYAIMAEAINDINTKKAMGLPITPDFKKKNIFLESKRTW